MVHVYNEATKTFYQVHQKKVAQRPAREVGKRQKNTEYMKKLLALEAAHPVKCIYTDKKE